MNGIHISVCVTHVKQATWVERNAATNEWKSRTYSERKISVNPYEARWPDHEHIEDNQAQYTPPMRNCFVASASAV